MTRTPPSARSTLSSPVGESPLGGHFGRDVTWNVGSLGVLAISGIALNVLIGRIYGPATLGVFNQVMAAYVLFSQAAAGGINFSVLQTIAEKPGDTDRTASIVQGALVPAVFLSGLVSLVFFASRFVLAGLLDSPQVADGMAAATMGLFFFGINKVLFAVINGLRRMRAFAVFQALRYVLILIGLMVAVVTQMQGGRLAFVFTFTECLLFLVLVVEVRWSLRRANARHWLRWIWIHLSFGLKAVLSTMLVEINARVDVLMLGFFLNDQLVGIYSLAAFFAEGVFQLMVVLQNNFNPVLARTMAEGRFEELKRVITRARWRIIPATGAITVLAVIVFPLVIPFFTDQPEFAQSTVPFAILLLGITIASGHLPFANALLMAGQPIYHTLFMVLVVATNVVGNALLIPMWGIIGGAIGTACAMAMAAVLLSVLVRWRTGFAL